MTLKIAYNTTDAPVLVDEQGYTIGGRSWGVVDTTSTLGQAEFAAGRLIDADRDVLAQSDNPDALAAVAALEARAAAVEAARGLSKEALVEALPPEQVAQMETGADGMPAKDDLVDAVAASGDVPEDDKKATTKSRAAAKK